VKKKFCNHEYEKLALGIMKKNKTIRP
jgi:hypothetical protein